MTLTRNTPSSQPQYNMDASMSSTTTNMMEQAAPTMSLVSLLASSLSSKEQNYVTSPPLLLPSMVTYQDLSNTQRMVPLGGPHRNLGQILDDVLDLMEEEDDQGEDFLFGI